MFTVALFTMATKWKHPGIENSKGQSPHQHESPSPKPDSLTKHREGHATAACCLPRAQEPRLEESRPLGSPGTHSSDLLISRMGSHRETQGGDTDTLRSHGNGGAGLGRGPRSPDAQASALSTSPHLFYQATSAHLSPASTVT